MSHYTDLPSVPRVRQLRLVVTADDYEAAVAVYRDALGLPELGAFTDPDGRVVILDAGRATLEIADPPHAAYVDRVEGVDRDAGRDERAAASGDRDAGATARTSGPRVRLAFEVTDAHGTTRRLESAGAHVVAEPVRTPWDSLNARLDGPADLELTVFQELGAPDVPPSAEE
jgi:catechol 2,3-dioxygenase-like lactoylglutathione lyase family enzyme